MTIDTSIDYKEAIEAREKLAIKEYAPTIIDIVKTFGLVTPSGAYTLNQKGGAKFSYDPLFQIVTVEHGSNDMFRANIALKTVAIFKTGSWERAYEDLKEQLEISNKDVARLRNFTTLLENMGLETP